MSGNLIFLIYKLRGLFIFMNRHNYNSKAIAIFDAIGSYFVDTFYNHHYIMAKSSVAQGRHNNITDAYRTNILNYMDGISRRDDLFKKVIYNLHEFYQHNSGFSSIVLSEFQDKVLSHFIPAEYYRDFTERNKDQTLRDIIVKSVNEFGEKIVSKQALTKIIDDHMNRDNVVFLQDNIVDIYIGLREEYHSKFAREMSKKNAGNTVDKEVAYKLKQLILDEKKKSQILTEDKDRALNMIRQLMIKIKSMESDIEKLNIKQQSYALNTAPAVTQSTIVSHSNIPAPTAPDKQRLSIRPPEVSARSLLYDDADDSLDEEEIFIQRQKKLSERQILANKQSPSISAQINKETLLPLCDDKSPEDCHNSEDNAWLH